MRHPDPGLGWPPEAVKGRPRPKFFCWLKWFLLTSALIPDGPCRSPAPFRTLKRPRGHPRLAEAIFLLKRFLSTSVLIANGPCRSPAPLVPSSGLKAVEGRLRANFFSSLIPLIVCKMRWPLKSKAKQKPMQPLNKSFVFWDQF